MICLPFKTDISSSIAQTKTLIRMYNQAYTYRHSDHFLMAAKVIIDNAVDKVLFPPHDHFFTEHYRAGKPYHIIALNSVFTESYIRHINSHSIRTISGYLLTKGILITDVDDIDNLIPYSKEWNEVLYAWLESLPYRLEVLLK